jgi:hypothetical protein
MNLSMASSERSIPLDRRRAERRTSPNLIAYHWSGSEPRLEEVRDISSTGVYLLTRECWLPGDMISLTLQRNGPPEGNIERRVAVQARAVRRDQYGVGMSFVFPAGVDLRLWDSHMMADSSQCEPEDVLREFRLAQALAFVQRLSPSVATELRLLMREGLSNYRVTSAIEIALRAEQILALHPGAETMHAPANLVLRILEDGSWVDSDAMQQMWAGLLATSCSVDGNDDSNAVFVDLFGQLTAPHVRLLTLVCERGAKYVSGFDRVSARAVTFSANELTQITGSRDLIRTHRDLEFLADLGLLTVTVRAVSFAPVQGTDVAASSLGLQCYARCCGHRGPVRSFYNLPVGVTAGLEQFDEGQPSHLSA